MPFNDEPPPCPAGELAGPVVPIRVKHLWAWVSEEDYDRVAQLSWRPQPRSHTTYAIASIARIHPTRGRYQTTIALHRYVLDAMPGVEVDHEIKDGLYCWRENLRAVSHSLNMQNTLRGSVAYRGVSEEKPRKDGTRLYRARIKDLAGVQRNMGTHVSAEDAAFAFDKAAFLLYGEGYLGFNFPDRVRAWALSEGHIKSKGRVRLPVHNDPVAQSQGTGYVEGVPF